MTGHQAVCLQGRSVHAGPGKGACRQDVLGGEMSPGIKLSDDMFFYPCISIDYSLGVTVHSFCQVAHLVPLVKSDNVSLSTCIYNFVCDE